MRSIPKIILFGAAIWIIAFVAGAFLFTPEGSPRLDMLLTQNIFYLLLTLTTLYFAYLYLKNLDMSHLQEGVIIGVSWVVISAFLDIVILLPLFDVSYANWVQQIFPALLVMPMMTIALGLAMQAKA